MKLNEILSGVYDLASATHPQLVCLLKVGDAARYMGESFTVATPLRKTSAGKLAIVLESAQGRVIRVTIPNAKGKKMTPKEKRVMVENIEGNLKNFAGESQKLLNLARVYYANLVEHNNYRAEDVKEVMAAFGPELLKVAGLKAN